MVSVAVIDGVTVGCPCCGHHNCHNPLQNIRDRFCSVHKSLDLVCSIVGCNEPVVATHRTCSDPAHQEVERVKTLRGQSRTILKDRLQRQKVAHPDDSVARNMPTTEMEDVGEVEEEFS